MVTVLIGEITEYNRYRIDDIRKKYHPALIINRNTSKGFKLWVKNIKRPIIGGRILLSITDNYKVTRRDFDAMKDILSNFVDHDYIDVLWMIPYPVGNFSDIVTELKLVNLRNTYRSDFEKYVQTKFPDVDQKQIRYLLNRISYNWNTYILYQEELLSQKTFSKKDIERLVTTKALTPIMEVLYNNLLRVRSGLKDYYSYCEKYSTTWVKNFYIDSISEIIKLKIMYYRHNSITITQIRGSDKYKRYYNIITKVPITDVYLLLTLLRTENYPLETYYNNQTKNIINNF